MTAPTATAERWAFLDAARGIASIAVVLQHSVWGAFAWAPDLFSTLWSPGRFGVVLFFFVSGYIVPHSLERRKSLKSFWVGRFWRLGPLYIFQVVLVSVLILLGVNMHTQYNPMNLKHLIGNLSLLQDFVGIPSTSAVSWTLGVEMLLYIGISIAFAIGFLSNTRLIVGVLLALFLAVGVIFPVLLHIRFPAGAIAVFTSILGGLLFYRAKAGDISQQELAAWLVANFAVVTISALLNYRDHRLSPQDIQPTKACAIISALSGFVVFWLLTKFKELKYPMWLNKLGVWSYSIYLLHGLVLHFVSGGENPYAKVSIQVGLSILAGFLGYTLIEKTGLELGKKFAQPRAD
ncbi:MAG: acyltransferase [Armatimonadota bacterium]